MEDYIVRGVAADNQIRCFGITAKKTVEEAKNRHGTSPVMTAALGRLLCGGAMMGSMMKGEKELLTLQIHGNGPAGGLTVTADAFGLCFKTGNAVILRGGFKEWKKFDFDVVKNDSESFD